MGMILYPDGTSREVSPANGSDYSLAELQAIVGGHIEIIRCKEPGKIIVGNDEAKLLDLPRNEQATALVQLMTPESLSAMRELLGDDLIIVGDPDEPDYIAGTVLVCRDDEVK